MIKTLWAAAALIAVPALAQNMPPATGNPSSGAPGAQNTGNPGGPPRRPPPEAIEACRGKTAGAACGFVNREGVSRQGSCSPPPAAVLNTPAANTPAGDAGRPPLACRPNHPPAAPGGTQ